MIYLHGYLREKYGHKHNIKVNSAGEAIRALVANYPSIINDLRKGYYKIRNKNKLITLDEINMTNSHTTYHIIPVPTGAKGGWSFFGVLVGAAMIGAAFWTGGASLAAWSAWQTGLALTGAGLILNSAAAMLTPMPAMPNYTDREAPDEKPSYLYNGPVNTTEQGKPIPLIYGRFVVGSTVIGVDASVEDVNA